ncbi:type VII secretion-associated protein [Nocardia puris]|uniref:Type VII secretion-associated protein (TIGR03931 family) n=1 Tax=Nocardia puris TaxID=208602 RepID=A0A366DFM8_9NOCA|nr:type VII secretion-associated protein [Nocardia puris]MBF6212512.1 type VII secretion-associated protein [Nocardia puris]MBF6366759.1 type VII secretion-associated protein [Nocardia puris]MBF6461101.1 type VII secretion-associated protein [Nocardia puris]RBO88872.1 type VII secretion-associated protein (TIGR03931 family) [Nocardia puris]
MPTVELVLTEARIWARGPATHWDAPPSVVLGSNGNLVVGEALNPAAQVSSAAQFVPADRIALLPRVPSVEESLTAVIGTALDNLGVTAPCERITIVCPTEWGGQRRAVVAAAAHRFAHDVVFEDMAVRAVASDDGTVRSRRTAVLEFGAVATTASTVTRDHQGVHLEACEYEPNLALAELGVDNRASEALAALLGRLLEGGPADLVQLVGMSDPAKLEEIRAVVHQVCGEETGIRPVAGPDLVRGAQVEPEYRPTAAPALPSNEWLQPLRERAAAQSPPRPTAKYALAAAGAVAVIAAVVVGGVVVFGGSDDDATASAPTTTQSAAPSGAGSPSTAPTTSASGAGEETVGRVRFEVPEGWKLGAPTTAQATRVDLSPVDGSRFRMTIVQTPVAADAGYAQVAANLEAQMRERPAMSDLRRDVVFGGRSGLAYLERPEGGSIVQWHVIVERGIQVSIGCQYVGNTWTEFQTTCEELAATVQVVP